MLFDFNIPQASRPLHHKFRKFCLALGCRESGNRKNRLASSTQRHCSGEYGCRVWGAVQQREPVKSFPKLLSRSSVTQDGLCEGHLDPHFSYVCSLICETEIPLSH